MIIRDLTGRYVWDAQLEPKAISSGSSERLISTKKLGNALDKRFIKSENKPNNRA